jgi:D-amino-acid dehydrogenase
MHHRPLVLRPHFDWHLLAWILAMLRNCTAARYDINKSRMVRLAEYSRDCMVALRASTGIRYDERTLGTLQLFRTQKQLDGTASDTAILDRYGVAYQRLDREGCVEHEPALARVRDKFVGGLRLPGDETGDCFKFTNRIAEMATARGARLRFGISIESLLTDGKRITGIVTDHGRMQADAYLVALGSHSPRLLAPLGVRVPIYPVKGYSITLPITDPGGAPASTVMDETHKVAVTRLGDRIRVGGTAELAGYSMQLHEARRRTLLHVVGDLFPGGGDAARAEFWCGLRPMTPDGTPVVGGTEVANLWLATGHGTLGWTMAAGTARVISDLMSGRAPAIDLAGLTIARYR